MQVLDFPPPHKQDPTHAARLAELPPASHTWEGKLVALLGRYPHAVVGEFGLDRAASIPGTKVGVGLDVGVCVGGALDGTGCGCWCILSVPFPRCTFPQWGGALQCSKQSWIACSRVLHCRFTHAGAPQVSVHMAGRVWAQLRAK